MVYWKLYEVAKLDWAADCDTAAFTLLVATTQAGNFGKFL